MTDLHGWITQQITDTEETARDATEGPWFAEHPEERWEAYRDSQIIGQGKPLANVNSEYNGHLNAVHIARHDPAAVLRRCAADRRILDRRILDRRILDRHNVDRHNVDRHNVDPSRAHDRLWATACHGCGWSGDCDDPVIDNVNDCPELLDLAHAHGITDDTLAALDRPEPPPRKPRPEPGHGFLIPDAIVNGMAEALTRMALGDVPAALRGPHWKDDAQ